MKQFAKILFLPVILLTCGVILVACGSNPPNPTYTASINKTTHNFGSAVEGYDVQTAEQFTITNTGNQPLEAGVSFLCTDFETATAISPAIIPVGGTATFSVRPVTGLDIGQYNSTIEVYLTAITNPIIIQLSFNVTAPIPSVSITPTTWDFGEVVEYADTSSLVKEFTITNNGGVAFVRLGLNFFGDNDVYAFGHEGSVSPNLAIGDSMTVRVGPGSSFGSLGTFTGGFKIMSDCCCFGGIELETVNLSVTIIGMTFMASVDETTHTFSPLVVEYQSVTAKQFTVTNTGNQPMGPTLNFQKASASPFEISTPISAPAGIILANENATFSIRPKADLEVGTHTDTFIISWGNGDDEFIIEISLSVTVQAKTFTASADKSSITFPNAIYGYSPQDDQQLTITNTGNSALENVSVALTSGADFEIGSVLSTKTISISVGGGVVIGVQPKNGLAVGEYSDTLTITWDNGTITIPLSFTVQSVLETPANTRIDDGKIKWDAVTNSTSYELRVGETVVYAGALAEWTMTGLHSVGTHNITVRAIGNATTYLNSTWSSLFVITYTETKLDTPANVRIQGDILKWDSVDNAHQYEIRIDGALVETISGTQWTITGLTDAGTYNLTVKAISDNTVHGTQDMIKYLDSSLSTPVAHTIVTYALTVTSATGGTLQTDVSGNYLAGTSITVTAITNTGFKFDGWFEDNVRISTSTSYTFDMPSNDRTIEARFVESYNEMFKNALDYLKWLIQSGPIGAGSVPELNITISDTTRSTHNVDANFFNPLLPFDVTNAKADMLFEQVYTENTFDELFERDTWASNLQFQATIANDTGGFNILNIGFDALGRITFISQASTNGNVPNLSASFAYTNTASPIIPS
jgi:hypothetical protein